MPAYRDMEECSGWGCCRAWASPHCRQRGGTSQPCSAPSSAVAPALAPTAGWGGSVTQLHSGSRPDCGPAPASAPDHGPAPGHAPRHGSRLLAQLWLWFLALASHHGRAGRECDPAPLRLQPQLLALTAARALTVTQLLAAVPGPSSGCSSAPSHSPISSSSSGPQACSWPLGGGEGREGGQITLWVVGARHKMFGDGCFKYLFTVEEL